MSDEIRLNLGAGATEIPGFTPIDRKRGSDVYPLILYSDNSVAEIRASHILEHFAQGEALAVLEEWVRVLKPGGRIRIAVPNLDWICRQQLQQGSGEYTEGSGLLSAYLMGGQTDEDDYHRSTWTHARLKLLMESAGLVDIREWSDDVGDCASLEVSLNLEGTKPADGAPAVGTPVKVSAVISVPRLCFVDTMWCAIEAFGPLGIPFKRHTSAFWNQSMTNVLEEAIDDGAELIFTVDYDCLFARADVEYMIAAMCSHPEFDALTGAIMKRDAPGALFTVSDGGGNLREGVHVDELKREFLPARSAHFGLAVLRASRLADLPRPWLIGVPDAQGRWKGQDREDPDMYFWRNWRENGRTLHQANHVRLGHMQLVATWPTKTFDPHFQFMADYVKHGRPRESDP